MGIDYRMFVLTYSKMVSWKTEKEMGGLYLD